MFYERSYYLAPDERGEKPYALLLRTLEKKSLTAIATITIRKKEQLCALRPKDGTLMLETLYYPDEIRAQPEVDLDKKKVTERELDMAFTLIDLLRKPFEPGGVQGSLSGGAEPAHRGEARGPGRRARHRRRGRPRSSIWRTPSGAASKRRRKASRSGQLVRGPGPGRLHGGRPAKSAEIQSQLRSRCFESP